VASVSTGGHRHDGRLIVGTYLTRWPADREADGLRPATVAVYELYVERDVVPAIGHLRLGDLRPGRVEKLLQDLRAAGRWTTTVRRIHATLPSALTSARRGRLVAYNAAADVTLPTASPARVRALPAELVTLAEPAARAMLGWLRGKQGRALICASTRTYHHVPGEDSRAHMAHRDTRRRAIDHVRAQHERHLGADLPSGVLIAERHRDAVGSDAVLQDHRRLVSGIDHI
jgi:hypothetical protein